MTLIKADDQWDGYQANRNRTFKTLYDNNIGNNIVVSGDSHANWVSDLVWLDNTPYDPARGRAASGWNLQAQQCRVQALEDRTSASRRPISQAALLLRTTENSNGKSCTIEAIWSFTSAKIRSMPATLVCRRWRIGIRMRSVLPTLRC